VLSKVVSTMLLKVVSKTVSKVITKGVTVVDLDTSKQGGGGVIVVGSGKGPVPVNA
jgi:hypothetical protein